MEKERLFDLCRKYSLENAIGMIVSNKIDIGGGMVGLTVDNAIQAVNDVLEYIGKPKRKPFDGKLRLTSEELKQFQSIFYKDYPEIVSIRTSKDHLMCLFMRDKNGEHIDSYKAILWLAERFELIKED